MHCLFEVTATPEQLWNTSHQGLTAFTLLPTVPLWCVFSCNSIKDALLMCRNAHFCHTSLPVTQRKVDLHLQQQIMCTTNKMWIMSQLIAEQ